MSLYADYLKERTNDLILEDEGGFATYRYVDAKTVYLIDIFVVPEDRKSGQGRHMADLIALEAKNKGCTEMLGTVIPSNKGSTTSLDVLRAYGMTLKSSAENLIIFRKDI